MKVQAEKVVLQAILHILYNVPFICMDYWAIKQVHVLYIDVL